MKHTLRTYSELESLGSIEERYEYLRLLGTVGAPTFGFDRYLNQNFYRSKEWRDLRHEVIVRDNGCDLGVDDYEIHGDLLIHHMNPILPADIKDADPNILDPEFLITTTRMTHNAIHYGDENLLPRIFVDRKPGDTLLW